MPSTGLWALMCSVPWPKAVGRVDTSMRALEGLKTSAATASPSQGSLATGRVQRYSAPERASDVSRSTPANLRKGSP